MNSAKNFYPYSNDSLRKQIKTTIKSEEKNLVERTESFQSEKSRTAYLNDYEKKVSQYMRCGFSYKSENFFRKLSMDQSIVSQITSKFPLIKLMKIIIKKMMLNELEMLYWLFFIEKNQFKYQEFSDYCIDVPDLISNSDYLSSRDYRSLISYLIYSSFSIKKLLNEDEEIMPIYIYFSQIYPSFSQTFNIIEKSQLLYLQPKHSDLNTVFKKYFSPEPITNLENENYIDYNSMVDEIIQISPPYNYEKYEHPEKIIQSTQKLKLPLSFPEKNDKTVNNTLELPLFKRESTDQRLFSNNNDINIPMEFQKLISKREPSLFEIDGNNYFRGDSFLPGFELGRNMSVNSEADPDTAHFNKNLLNLSLVLNYQDSERLDENDKGGKRGFKLAKSGFNDKGNLFGNVGKLNGFQGEEKNGKNQENDDF